MLFTPLVLLTGALAATITLPKRENTNSVPNVVRSTWDGQCFYPTADETFELNAYLGKWYQIAGTVAPFTAGCTCISAEYSLESNGTVRVSNKCQAQGRIVDILGNAAPADAAYGSKGVLRVQFPGSPPPECPGPNYIVQGGLRTETSADA